MNDVHHIVCMPIFRSRILDVRFCMQLCQKEILFIEYEKCQNQILFIEYDKIVLNRGQLRSLDPFE
jgi:hypothetical protein